MLLQVLDDGRLTDGQGRTVDFRNTVIIMTSNLGFGCHPEVRRREQLRRDEIGSDGSGAGEFPAGIHQSHRRHLRVPSAGHGADPRHRRHPARAAQAPARSIAISSSTLDDSALDRLSEAGYDPVYGARPLKRAIQQQVENPLAQAILSGKFVPGDRIRGHANGNGLEFDKQK